MKKNNSKCFHLTSSHKALNISSFISDNNREDGILILKMGKLRLRKTNLSKVKKTLEESLGLQGDQTSQSLKEISPEYSLEGLMLKLKLQYFGHLMRRTDSFEKTLMLGKLEGGSRRG